jgi:hypothetical protein
MRNGNLAARFFGLAAFVCLSVSVRAGEVIYEAHGGDAQSIRATVDAFREALGANNKVGGAFAGGRREINWDAVPAAFLDPLPGNFFNQNSPRGLVMSTPGARLKVSGDEGAASFLFKDVTAQAWGLTEFAFFSPQKIFAPLGSVVTELTFFVPGTSTPAVVNGFGAVFVDVDAPELTKIEYFNASGGLISSHFVAPGGVRSRGLSFLGVLFTAGERAATVRITAGEKPIDSPWQNPPPDGVAMDDFIYGEPRPAHSSELVRSAAGPEAAAIQAALDQFRADLGALNPNTAGSKGAGRREINWDAVPDGFSAPNNLPAAFFNSNSPRGAVFSGSGSGFQVSAKTGNAAGAPPLFGNLNADYPVQFGAFSPERLFTALGSNVTDVTFFVPGGSAPATVSGFGAVFADVDATGSTAIEYFDAQGISLGRFDVPAAAGSKGFSFLGVSFSGAQRVSRVRITSGNQALGNQDNPPGSDVVAMDDFIYGEPLENSARPQVVVFLPHAADGSGYQTAALLGNPRGVFVTGRIEFFTGSGAPMPIGIVGRGVGTAFDFTLAPGASLRLQTDGSSNPLQVGYAKLTSDGEIQATALFQVLGAGGLITEAGVAKSTPTRKFQVFATTLNNVFTGVAFVNVGQQVVSAALRLLRLDGSLAGEANLVLQPGEHSPKFVSELFAGVPGISSFEGTLVVAADGDLAATALRMQLQPTLTLSALPVTPIAE